MGHPKGAQRSSSLSGVVIPQVILKLVYFIIKKNNDMELIKKALDVKDAAGWYLVQSATKTWTEDIADEETKEIISFERSGVILQKGALINPLDISTLQENGITTVQVSNVPILGDQRKWLSLWEVTLKISERGIESKKCYVVTADSPADAEKFIAEYFAVNIESTFEVVKVSKLEYDRVAKMYDTERENLEKERKRIKWYKCQIYSMIDDEDTGTMRNAGMKNIIIQALSLEYAIDAIKFILGRNEFDAAYQTFKLLQETNIVDVFAPYTSVSYYSNSELTHEDD
ncbi:MAG: DUF4494 domain-containing protein [Tannerellaceae bacterium]|jgi:hypothetical protein|nr:DUF4494 domain-containing protein [Tannerellaceae bacterium]